MTTYGDHIEEATEYLSRPSEKVRKEFVEGRRGADWVVLQTTDSERWYRRVCGWSTDGKMRSEAASVEGGGETLWFRRPEEVSSEPIIGINHITRIFTIAQNCSWEERKRVNRRQFGRTYRYVHRFIKEE